MALPFLYSANPEVLHSWTWDPRSQKKQLEVSLCSLINSKMKRRSVTKPPESQLSETISFGWLWKSFGQKHAPKAGSNAWQCHALPCQLSKTCHWHWFWKHCANRGMTLLKHHLPRGDLPLQTHMYLYSTWAQCVVNTWFASESLPGRVLAYINNGLPCWGFDFRNGSFDPLGLFTGYEVENACNSVIWLQPTQPPLTKLARQGVEILGDLQPVPPFHCLLLPSRTHGGVQRRFLMTCLLLAWRQVQDIVPYMERWQRLVDVGPQNYQKKQCCKTDGFQKLFWTFSEIWRIKISENFLKSRDSRKNPLNSLQILSF